MAWMLMERHENAGSKRDQMMWGGSEGLEMYIVRASRKKGQTRENKAEQWASLTGCYFWLPTDAWLTNLTGEPD